MTAQNNAFMIRMLVNVKYRYEQSVVEQLNNVQELLNELLHLLQKSKGGIKKENLMVIIITTVKRKVHFKKRDKIFLLL